MKYRLFEIWRGYWYLVLVKKSENLYYFLSKHRFYILLLNVKELMKTYVFFTIITLFKHYLFFYLNLSIQIIQINEIYTLFRNCKSSTFLVIIAIKFPSIQIFISGKELWDKLQKVIYSKVEDICWPQKQYGLHIISYNIL